MEVVRSSNNRQHKMYGVMLSVSLFFILLLAQCTSGPTWASPITFHKSSISPIWMQSDIYATENSQSLLVSSNDKAFLLGSNHLDREPEIIAFDGATGRVLWQVSSQNGQSVITQQSTVIVGGVGEVFALESVTGHKVWSRHLQSRSVTNMYTVGSEIFVDTISSRYFVLDPNSGATLQSIDYSVDNSKLPYWRNIPLGAYWQAPVYSDHYLYGRTGERSGYVFAIDLDGSTELWKTDENIISNVAVTTSHAYMLSEDGKLLEVELATGQQKVMVEFDAVPFNFTSTPSGGYTYSYYVAVSSDERIIYVLLGDSAQLYAFQLAVSQP